jgi:hypothetical protein
LPDKKAGNPYHNVSQTFNNGDHHSGLDRQPDKLANQNQRDFLYPERARDKEADTSAHHA